MNNNLQYRTHGKIMHRVKKTDANIYGATQAKKVSIRKPCIVIFGGELTSKIKDANYYASFMKRLISFYKITGIEIYSAYYSFEERAIARKIERANTFVNARSKLLNKMGAQKPVDTQYINDLYQMIIRPRIVDNDGLKLPDQTALQNIRETVFFTHCHGSIPVYAFQDIMAKDMRELGYSATAIRNIMKNLLVIQHAPVSPLEKSKFNTVSFMSANDTLMNFHNKFSEYVADHSEDLPPSYFPLGNFFAVYGFTHELTNEHQIEIISRINQDMLTPDGAMIAAAERNAIVNGLRAAQAGAPTPNIRDLIAPASKKEAVKPDFDTLASNGEFFMRLMQHDLHLERSNER